MIITRDKNDDGMICFWKHGTDVVKSTSQGVYEWLDDDDGDWNILGGLMFELSPKRFKETYPTKRLPRKGSYQIVRKREYE